MPEEKKKQDVVAHGSNPDSLLVIFATLGDTTWRMFGPVLLGAGIGIWIDNSTVTSRAGIVGAVIGLVIAGLLVWDQYRRVMRGNR